MNRLHPVQPESAPQPIADLYGEVQKKLGLVPNMVKALGNSAASLRSYVAFGDALAGGVLRASTREKVALRVAELNRCDYCLSAHTAIGGLLKVPADAVLDARRGRSGDAREQAILELVDAIVETRGAVPDARFRAAVAAGLDGEVIAEVAAHVALNVFTNYFNRLAETEIDFPEVRPFEVAACHGGACAAGPVAAGQGGSRASGEVAP